MKTHSNYKKISILSLSIRDNKITKEIKTTKKALYKTFYQKIVPDIFGCCSMISVRDPRAFKLLAKHKKYLKIKGQ